MPLLSGPRPTGRRLYRRILVALLAVALLPLAALTLLVGADLSQVNQTTVDQARQTIVADAQERESSAATDAASRLELALGQLSTDLGTLSSTIDTLIRSASVASEPATLLSGGVALVEVGGTGATLVAAHSSAVSQDAYADPLGSTRAQILTALDALRKHHPELSAVWLYSSAAGALTETPVRDVQTITTLLENNRIDPAHLLDRQLAAAERSTPAPGAGASGAGGGAGTGVRAAPTLWSDVDTAAFQTGASVTAWSPAGSNGWTVGAELPTSAIASYLPSSLSALPDAWTGLVSSSGRWMMAGPNGVDDLGLGSGYEGSPAAIPGLSVARLASSHPQPLPATLGSGLRDVFTAPVTGLGWTLLDVVPDRDIAPAAVALGDGLRAAERRILLFQVLPLALLLGAVAVTLSWLFSRRLVGPVRALTASAERLAEGHTDEPVPRQGDDEVGLLSETLERMRTQVNSQHEELLTAARDLEQRVADRTAELRDRNEELVALNALGRTLTRSLDPEELAHGAVRALASVLPTRAVAAYTTSGATPVRVATMPAEATGLAAILDGAAAEAPPEATVCTRAGQRILTTPVVSGGDTVGLLVAVLAGTGEVPDRLRTLVGAVADQLALALRTAQLSAEGRDLAVLEERTRLAREIHDTIAQQLTGIVLQLEATATLLGRDDTARSHALVVAARDQARLALAEARRSVWNLRPVPLEAAGLAGAASLEVARLQERTGIRATLRNHGVPVHLALPPQAEVAVFRILQEALSNVARHSGARRVDVDLRAVAGDLRLTISDDGQGFDASAGDDDSGSFGIVGMRERAALIGGRFAVTTARGGGTVVTLEVPLQQQATRADA
ncbi:MAG: sensor histidine kinase [Candidatus Dormibacteria bacterium]